MPGEMSVAVDAEPNWLSADEMRAWRAYIDGSQRLMEVLNRELQETNGMSLADYRILVNLVESPNGALRMSDLAADVVSSRSRLTHQVRRMEAADLVTRRTCDEDGRG